MKVKELSRIVCSCLDELGITPLRARTKCEKWVPEELDLDQQTLVRLIACIVKKVKAQGQTVVIGKTMWRKSATVREFCEALAENLE